MFLSDLTIFGIFKQRLGVKKIKVHCERLLFKTEK